MNPILQQLQIEINDAVYGLDTTETQAKPQTNPDKWTIQQIIRHLCLSYSSTAGAIQERLAKGTPTANKSTARQRLAQFYVTTLGLFPNGREAPKVVVPPSDEPPVSGDDLTCSAADDLELMDKLLDEAESVFGTQRCITHGILGPLSVHQWRKFHLVHGDHHVRQVLAIRSARNL